MNNSINNWPRKKFLEVMPRSSWEEPIICYGVVILPMPNRHDSGYRNMDFIALDKDQKPICRLAGSSDVLHLDGIGGKPCKEGRTTPWSIDCLPVSGLLRVFFGGRMVAKCSLLDFELVSLND